MPLLTVAKAFQKKYKNLQILYLGSGNALEKQLVQGTGFEYYAISTGKLRRYFSWENVRDFFRFFQGIRDASKIIKKTQPKLVFSKGGYVSLPVCLAAYWQKIPIILHESDSVMGLANSLISRIAKRICMSFDLKPQKSKYKYLLTGSPVRPELLKGQPKKIAQKLGFNLKKPVLLIMGGSQGAQFLNELVYDALDQLLTQFQIIHICGQGKRKLLKKIGYANFEYVTDELADYYALADLIVSRAGANALAEISALQKPNLIIPLPTSANNHQQKNAEYFAQHKASLLLEQKNLTAEKFLATILNLWQNQTQQKEMQENLKKEYHPNALAEIVKILSLEL